MRLLFPQEAVVHITAAQVLRRPAMTALGVATSIMMHHPGTPPANTVLTLTFTGRFGECGLAADCGCVPNAPRIPPQYFVPPEAAPYISVAELNKIAAEISAVLANNYVPMFPIILLHIVAVCVLGYYSSRMDSKLDQFIDSINTETYVARNCHWYNFSKLHFGVAYLTQLPGVRYRLRFIGRDRTAVLSAW
jgi:hypothetical protein